MYFKVIPYVTCAIMSMITAVNILCRGGVMIIFGNLNITGTLTDFANKKNAWRHREIHYFVVIMGWPFNTSH